MLATCFHSQPLDGASRRLRGRASTPLKRHCFTSSHLIPQFPTFDLGGSLVRAEGMVERLNGLQKRIGISWSQHGVAQLSPVLALSFSHGAFPPKIRLLWKYCGCAHPRKLLLPPNQRPTSTYSQWHLPG